VARGAAARALPLAAVAADRDLAAAVVAAIAAAVAEAAIVGVVRAVPRVPR